MKKALLFLTIPFLLWCFSPAVRLPAGNFQENTREAAAISTAEPLPEDLLDRLVFFGDSTTYGFFRYNLNNTGVYEKNYYTLKASQIWVPQERTFYLGNLFTAEIALSEDQKMTLSEAARTYRPEYLLLTVGINGLCQWNEENFSRYYEKMIDLVEEASPDTTILLHSVYPTASNIGGRLTGFTNDKIDRLNSWIQKIAEKRGLFYLDSASALKDERGCLPLAYQNGDGLHLNTQGFNAVLKNIDRIAHSGQAAAE